MASEAQSEGVGFHRNDVSTTHHAVEPAAADQPIDLSTQRRNVEPKPEHISPPYRTHVNATTSDEPLDLSQSSSSMRPDTQTSRHPSHSARPWDSGSKVPSGMIDLQNYCNLLLSGGYSLDSPLSTITPLSSFSSLVSKVYFTRILSTAKLLTTIRTTCIVPYLLVSKQLCFDTVGSSSFSTLQLCWFTAK